MDTTEELPTVISFCSGYGGIERGLDLAGLEHRVIAFLEIEAFAIANLVNKMEDGIIPPAPIYTDIKTFPSEIFRGKVSILTGGYPCQPFSAAGKRLGADDPRHLWPHIRRHIESIRPARCFFENVEGHISLGLSSVISDLEEDGYGSAWGIFSAREVGAPHQRKRVYILANSKNSRCVRRPASFEPQGTENHEERPDQNLRSEFERSSKVLANSSSERLEGHARHGKDCDQSRWVGEKEKRPVSKGSLCNGEPNLWAPEPGLGRVVDGCANRVDRIRLLGNGVVPQTAAKAYTTLSERLR